MCNVSREKGILETKRNARVKTLTEIRNVFDGLVSRLNTAEERITALVDIPIGLPN